MSTDAEDALEDLFIGRGEPGEAGFRPYEVEIWFGYKGENIRQIEAVRRIPIREGGGFNPKVRWLKDEELAVGNLERGTVEVGPITPKFPGGGTDLAILRGDELRGGDEFHVFLRGPKHPFGALYLRSALRAERPTKYFLQAKPTEVTFEPP